MKVRRGMIHFKTLLLMIVAILLVLLVSLFAYQVNSIIEARDLVEKIAVSTVTENYYAVFYGAREGYTSLNRKSPDGSFHEILRIKETISKRANEVVSHKGYEVKNVKLNFEKASKTKGKFSIEIVFNLVVPFEFMGKEMNIILTFKVKSGFNEKF